MIVGLLKFLSKH